MDYLVWTFFFGEGWRMNQNCKNMETLCKLHLIPTDTQQSNFQMFIFVQLAELLFT